MFSESVKMRRDPSTRVKMESLDYNILYSRPYLCYFHYCHLPVLWLARESYEVSCLYNWSIRARLNSLRDHLSDIDRTQK